MACLPLAFLLAGDARTAEAALSLALVCGGAAAASLLYATYREHVVIRRTIARLRDPEQRERTLARLRAKVFAATRSGDTIRVEEALRSALEPLLVVGLWDEVNELAALAGDNRSYRQPFARWLAGVHALAQLHRGNNVDASAILEATPIEGPWLIAVDALRRALAGDGDGALQRLGDGPRRPSYAIVHQRRLARAHAYVASGKRDQAREILKAMQEDGVLEAVLAPEGPASGIAAELLSASEAGPFRAAG